MSLLIEAMEPCVILTETVTSDGRGGYTAEWAEGAGFDAACVLSASAGREQASAAVPANSYVVTTGRETVLMFHDVFRRESDGKIFRVTSDGPDRRTPLSAGLNMRQVTAEEWKLNG